MIAAVNESIWEHLKLAFWPALIYSAIEYHYLKDIANNILIAKQIGLYLMPIIITAVYYSYQLILDVVSLGLIPNLLLFSVAIVSGQLVSYKLLTSSQLPENLNRLVLILLILIILSFSLFTFNPPEFILFRDPLNGRYGILTKK